jgi:hypothetical protein
MSSTNIGQSTFKYVILVFVILAIVIGTLIGNLGSTKSKFTDQNANANSNPQVNISESQLAIASYVGMGLLVVAGVAILAIYLHPRV